MRRFLLGVMIAFSSANARAEDVDWKYLGSTGDGNAAEYMFFDQSGIKPTGNNHFKVWVKGISKIVLDKEQESAPDKEAIDDVVIKVASGYIPPFLTTMKHTQDDVIGVTVLEHHVAKGSHHVSSRIFYEIDCKDTRLRELSIYFEREGKIGSTDAPNKWSEIPPETNASTLAALVCKVAGAAVPR